MGCCEENTSGTYVPENVAKKFGIDHAKLAGYKGGHFPVIMSAARAGLSEDGYMEHMKVKLKDSNAHGIYINSEHQVISANENKEVRKSGWLIVGIADTILYVPEDEFSLYFDIIKEEE